MKDLTVTAFVNRPKWHEDRNREMAMALSQTEKLVATRMDMVVAAGKSVKNNDAFVIIPPDVKEALTTLILKRDAVGIPVANPFLFARPTANTSLTGNTELSEIVHACPGIKHPERIKSTGLRKYIATVTQV